jgi:hypothetical protein
MKAEGLAIIGEALAELTDAARDGHLDDTDALSALDAIHRLAAQLEHSELALIQAARDAGATWAQIATALGTGNRQTAQKRHADLTLRLQATDTVAT